MTGKEMNKDENLISHCGLYCETVFDSQGNLKKYRLGSSANLKK